MIELYTPRSEAELMILRSILEDAGVRLFVRNERFGSLFALSSHAEARARATLCVAECDRDDAEALLAEFLRRTGREHLLTPPEPPPPGPLAALLARVEACIEAWIERRRPAAGPPRLRVIRNAEPPPAAAPEGERPPLRLVRASPAPEPRRRRG